MKTHQFGLDVLGHGGGGGGHGGHGHGGHGGHGGPGWGGWGGPGWWGGYGYDEPYYVDVVEEVPLRRCVAYDNENNCLIYAPIDEAELLGDYEADRKSGILPGGFNIETAQRNMNDLKPVTVEIARVLLSGGQEAINGAIAAAKQPWYRSDLPGAATRKEVQDHLKWHEDNLKKFTDLKAPYPGGSDLKQFTMRAYIESNAVSEGTWYLSWQAMWDRIKVLLAQAIRDGIKFAAGATSEVVSTVTGVPMWAIIGGAIVLVGGGGYLAYRTGIAGHYLKRLG